MQQKTTWILYLIIGISLTFFSRKKEVNDPIQKATYIYKNMIDSIFYHLLAITTSNQTSTQLIVVQSANNHHQYDYKLLTMYNL